METRQILVGASFPKPIAWSQQKWRKHYRTVRRLQTRIVKAQQAGKKRLVRALQHILARSLAAKALAVRRVTENQGKRSAGIDGENGKPRTKKPKPLKPYRQRGIKLKL